MIDPAGDVVTYLYDDRGYLTKVSVGGSTGSWRVSGPNRVVSACWKVVLGVCSLVRTSGSIRALPIGLRRRKTSMSPIFPGRWMKWVLCEQGETTMRFSESARRFAFLAVCALACLRSDREATGGAAPEKAGAAREQATPTATRLELTPLENAALESLRSATEKYRKEMRPLEDRYQMSEEILRTHIIFFAPPGKAPPDLKPAFGVVLARDDEKVPPWTLVLFEAALESLAKLQERTVSDAPFLEYARYHHRGRIGPVLEIMNLEVDCDDVGILIHEWDLTTGEKLEERYPALLADLYWFEPRTPVRRHFYLQVTPRESNAMGKDEQTWNDYLRRISRISRIGPDEWPEGPPPVCMSPPSPNRVIVIRMYDAAGNVSNGVQPIWLEPLQWPPLKDREERSSVD